MLPFNIHQIRILSHQLLTYLSRSQNIVDLLTAPLETALQHHLKQRFYLKERITVSCHVLLLVHRVTDLEVGLVLADRLTALQRQ